MDIFSAGCEMWVVPTCREGHTLLGHHDDEQGCVTSMVDSDQVGCIVTRKSFTGGLFDVERGCLKAWSTTGGVALRCG